MVRIEQIAHAALEGNAVAVRSLARDWLVENPIIADYPRPSSSDVITGTVCAALVELFAERATQSPPNWSGEYAALDRPLYLLKSAQTMPRLRRLCDAESPGPLRRRNLLAPPQFLQFV
jgi:hypothetical protein